MTDQLLQMGLGACWLATLILSIVITHLLTARSFMRRPLVALAMRAEPIINQLGGLYAAYQYHSLSRGGGHDGLRAVGDEEAPKGAGSDIASGPSDTARGGGSGEERASQRALQEAWGQGGQGSEEEGEQD